MLNIIFVKVLQAFVWIYTVLTLPIYAIIQRPWLVKKMLNRKKAEPIPSTDGYCIQTTADIHPIQLEMLANKLDTLPKVFIYSCKKNANKKALGTRELLGESTVVQRDGKVLKKLDLGTYKWVTFSEAEEVAKNFGNGLRHFGLTSSKKIVMFAETRKEWLLSAMGAFQQRCTICTLYTTLDEEALVHGITETEVEVIITSSSLLEKVKAVLIRCPRVKAVITFTDPLSNVETSNNCPKIWTFDDIVNEGKANSYEDIPQPTADDIAIIMYTSGSTGVPKGVMLSHSNITSSMIMFSALIATIPSDVYLAYLPLAHVLELLGETTMLICGVPMGYSTPLTLTDVSSKIKKGSKGDASILKPTIVPAVPLILDRIYKAANEKAASSGPILKELFDYFIQYRLNWFKTGWNTPICNRIIFKKTRDLLGGNVRAMGCGGAPLSTATHDLIRAVLGVNVAQGYGLTETCATASMMDHVNDFSSGGVGTPFKFCDVKLIDWNEGGYTIHDKPNPRGELVIGGPNISSGYFKNPSLTKETFYEIDDQRWVRTGDIGEIFPNGSIQIIDRRKDLVKLQMGEYISLGKIESVLKLCSIVDNICIYGQASHMNVIAIVSLNLKALKELEETLGAEFSQEEGKIRIKAAVINSLAKCAKKGKLSRLETPTDCYLTLEAWTPENKLVTTTMKIKRKNIELKYKEEINALYHR